MAGDVIDLRDMGVTAGNFAEKVLIEAVRGGSRITIDGQSMNGLLYKSPSPRGRT